MNAISLTNIADTIIETTRSQTKMAFTPIINFLPARLDRTSTSLPVKNGMAVNANGVDVVNVSTTTATNGVGYSHVHSYVLRRAKDTLKWLPRRLDQGLQRAMALCPPEAPFLKTQKPLSYTKPNRLNATSITQAGKRWAGVVMGLVLTWPRQVVAPDRRSAALKHPRRWHKMDCGICEPYRGPNHSLSRPSRAA